MPSYYGALARLKKGRHPRCQFSTDLTCYLQVMLGLSFASSKQALCRFSRRAASAGLGLLPSLIALPATVDPALDGSG